MNKLEQMVFDHIHSGYYCQTIQVTCQSSNEYVAKLTDCNDGRTLLTAKGNTIIEAIEAMEELLTKKEPTT